MPVTPDTIDVVYRNTETTWPMWIDWLTSTPVLAAIAMSSFGIAWLRHLERNDP